MKKIIALILTSILGVTSYAQSNTASTAPQTVQQSNDAVQQITVPNFTSINSDYIEIGTGCAFQTDCGVIGYIDIAATIIKQNELMENFALDASFGAEYTDMHSEFSLITASVKPSYHLYTYNGIDINGIANVDLGYGCYWAPNNNEYSTCAYGCGVGIEFAMKNIYIKPYYNWTNYELFNSKGTITNHAIGGEVGVKIPTEEVGFGSGVDMALIVNYSHVFSTNETRFDDEDRITFGIRLMFP